MKNIEHHGLRSGPGWCHWQVPPALVARLASDPLVSEFLVSRSGYFPKAWHNAAWRPNPLRDTIFALCLDGEAWVGDMTNPQAPRVPIKAGEVLLVPLNTSHSYGADEKNPWTPLWFHAIGPRVARYLAELKVAGQPYKGRLANPAPVKASIERINELRRRGCGRPILLESNALGELVFARLSAEGCLEPVSSVLKPDLAKRSPERLQKLEQAVAFLHENYRQGVSLRSAARACHVSESWLCHAFPEYTGFSPLGFVIHLRLHEACRLLATTGRKLEDIAASVGYDDGFYFSRLFKKHMGLTPSEYRQDYSRGQEPEARS
jgi:AraC family transcriptional regulator, arabinose operon regulatory protein